MGRIEVDPGGRWGYSLEKLTELASRTVGGGYARVDGAAAEGSDVEH